MTYRALRPLAREHRLGGFDPTNAIGDGIGCRGLLVHCETDVARAFSRRLVPEFGDSPTDPLHLVLRMKDLRRTLGEALS